MQHRGSSPTLPNGSIALVGGDTAMRHARQLMFRAEGYDVRAYPGCDALLTDPAAIASDCIIADVDMRHIGGMQLVKEMRAIGWHGVAVLLTDTPYPQLATAAIDEHFTILSPKAIADRPLLDAVTEATHGLVPHR
ncbi:MAG: response regulator [Sphingomonas sp.]